MRFRRNPLPSNVFAILPILCILVLVNLLFIFDLVKTFPAVYALGSFRFNVSILLLTFFYVTIMGHFMACMLIDTGIDKDHIKTLLTTRDNEQFADWRQCQMCECAVPPKAWHCKWCHTCILKRDHHCLFSGYCIGLQNHRHFICFLFYSFLGAIYSSAINYCYIMEHPSMFKTVLRNALQPWGIFTHSSSYLGINYVHLLVFMVSMCSVFFSLAALLYAVPLMLRGHASVHHSPKPVTLNREVAYLNYRCVFGQRGVLPWIFPFIDSHLPNNGYSFKE